MQEKCNDEDQDVKAIAEEIKAYLKSRGHVADTIDGIAHWWVLRQRMHEERIKVERAVEYLCASDLISKHQLADGTVIYGAKEHIKPPQDPQGNHKD